MNNEELNIDDEIIEKLGLPKRLNCACHDFDFGRPEKIWGGAVIVRCKRCTAYKIL